ncbi:MAG: hypothetical protein RQ745_13690 [Longimicrobiales bacterium]|nr:hypothetical protein [Longimicrobiales bacterium]
MMIRNVNPSRARDVIGVVMLVMTAMLLWAQTNDRVMGAGVDEQVEAGMVVGAGAPGPHAPIEPGVDCTTA